MIKNWAKLAQYVCGGIIIILLGYVLFCYFGPLGFSILKINFGNTKLPNYVSEVDGLASPEKNLKSGEKYRRVLRSTVNLKVKLFKTYKNLEVKLKYNNSKSNFAFLGAILKSPFKYGKNNKITKILDNKLFEDIDWYKIIDKKLSKILYQKGDDICFAKVKDLEKDKDEELSIYQDCAQELDKESNYLKLENKNKQKSWVNYRYNNINNFLADLSNIVEQEKVCYFNLENLEDKISLLNYSPNLEINSFDVAFKGFQVIEIYLDNENLDFNFDYYDLNLDSEKSDFSIFVYKGDEKILEKKIEDDGNTSGDEIKTEIKNINLIIPNLEKGRYKIYLDAGNDIVFNSFKTRQKYWVFLDEVNFYGLDKSIELYTDAKNLEFLVDNEKALQTINIRKEKNIVDQKDADEEKLIEKKLKITNTDKIYYYNFVNSLSKINIEKADLRIKFGGRLASSLETIENLNTKNLTNFINFNKFDDKDCDYIISDYFNEPSEKGSYNLASADFNISDLYIDKENNIELLAIFPKYVRGNDDDIKLKSLNLKYSR